MGALGKFIIGIGGVFFTIVIMSLIIPAEMQQQKATSNLVQQDLSQLNNADLKLVGDCQTFTSVADLTGCKTQLTSLKSSCQTPTYSSMSVCSDSRIDQFLSTVDTKIAYAQNVLSTDAGKLNTTYSNLLNQCSQASDPNTLASCKSIVIQIQQDCSSMSSLNVPVCNDPRITQILTKQISQASSVLDAASQNMESFVSFCMAAQDNNTIQTCATEAKQMINLCQSTTVQACTDPRLQQIASMGQATNYAPSPPADQAPNGTTFATTNTAIESALNECGNSAISNSSICTNGLNSLKQECQGPLKPYISQIPACNDPRLR